MRNRGEVATATGQRRGWRGVLALVVMALVTGAGYALMFVALSAILKG